MRHFGSCFCCSFSFGSFSSYKSIRASCVLASSIPRNVSDVSSCALKCPVISLAVRHARYIDSSLVHTSNAGKSSQFAHTTSRIFFVSGISVAGAITCASK
ncbi:hypothetical protein bcere0013_49550 [Bacillus cereus BDRD-ST26]|nr:hypothetical protein bcere0013_49550 [Bacillus cereus BDRD-ST26]